MKRQLLNLLGAVGVAGALVLASTMVVYPAISQLAGLAVAQSSTQWNNVKDAAAGDGLTSGLLASGMMMFNGVSFDRVRGDTTNGIDVDVTRISGTLTPADGVANPTGLLGVEVFNMVFNGSIWDRLRGTTTTGLLTQKLTVGSTVYAIKRTNITTASVNLAFGATSRKVSLVFPITNTDEVCVSWAGGTAVCPAANTAGNDRYAPGDSILVDDIAITSVSVIAASGTQTVYVRAWR